MRICLVSLSLGHYHVMLYEALSRRIPGGLDVIELPMRPAGCSWDTTAMPVSFRRHTLSEPSGVRLAVQACRLLSRLSPQVVVVIGYRVFEMALVALWARSRGLPVLFTSDTIAQDHVRNPLLERIKATWLKLYWGALVPGSLACDYLISLGFDAARVFTGGIWSVENRYFADRVLRYREDSSLRTELGLPESYFLYVGRLAPEKNVQLLLEALAATKPFRLRDSHWGCVLVGDGPLRNDLEDLSRALGIAESVHFVGFKQLEDLVRIYALASVLVLPSQREPWGMVVNEAMACGLPVLVSDRAGCVPELVRDGLNGYSFDPSCLDELVLHLTHCVMGDYPLPAMGEASARLIEDYDIQRSAGIAESALLLAGRSAKP